MDYKRILNGFRKKNILVVGDLILDHYIWGSVDRISPEAPVPVVTVKDENYLLGGSGNVANNIASLGARVAVAGLIGKDHRGKLLLERLVSGGIGTEGVLETGRSTTVKTRIMAHSQQVVRVDRENSSRIEERHYKKLVDFINNSMKHFDAVIISDYRKGLVTDRIVRHINRLARVTGIFVSADPKVGNFPCYRGVSLITPNKKEAEEGSGINIKDEKTLLRAGKRLISKFRCKSVLITRGEEGMSLFDSDEVHHIPTVARHVYDVTGAGDTVISAFTLARVSGASLLQAAKIANHAAGIVVGEVGTATATTEAILGSMNERHQ